jgi:hypothetical protein
VTRLVLDSGGLTRLSARRRDSAALIAVFRRDGLWPPLVPSVVLVEALSGRQRRDAAVNRLLVLGGDHKDLRARATHADDVSVHRA